jgi:hypothetical protein
LLHPIFIATIQQLSNLSSFVSPAINFSQRDKILDLKDDDPSLYVAVDPDQFIKDLKALEPNHWDPLPCNIRQFSSWISLLFRPMIFAISQVGVVTS